MLVKNCHWVQTFKGLSSVSQGSKCKYINAAAKYLALFSL